MANGKAELTLEQLRELSRPYYIAGYIAGSCPGCGTVLVLPNGDFEHDDPCVLKDAIAEAERRDVKVAEQLIAEADSCWDAGGSFEISDINLSPAEAINVYLADAATVCEVELTREVGTGTVFGAFINGEPKWFLSREEAQAAIDAAAKSEEESDGEK